MNSTAAAAAALVRPLHLVSPPTPVEPQLHAAPALQPIFEFTAARRPLPTRSYGSHDSTEKLLLEADLLFNQLAHGSSLRTQPPLPFFFHFT
jgi:hypothetical protein